MNIKPGKRGQISAALVASGSIKVKVRYRPSDGSSPRQVTATGATRAAATRALDRRIAEVQAGLDTVSGDAEIQDAARRSLASLMDDLFAQLEHVGKIRAQSLAEYRRTARATIAPAVGHWQVADIRPRELSTYLQTVWQATPGSYKTVRTIFSQAFDLAILHGDILDTPLRGIRAPHKNREAPTVLAGSGLERLRAVIADLVSNPPQRPGPRSRYGDVLAVIDTQLATGMRVGECLGLRWRDVHLDAHIPYLDVEETVVRTAEDGLHVQAWTTSHASRRGIRLPAWAVDGLRERS